MDVEAVHDRISSESMALSTEATSRDISEYKIGDVGDPVLLDDSRKRGSSLGGRSSRHEDGRKHVEKLRRRVVWIARGG